MSQVTEYVVGDSPLTMTQLKTSLDSFFAAMGSKNKGATAPSNPFNGMTWIDDSSTPWLFKIYDTTNGWTTTASFDATTGIFTPYYDGAPVNDSRVTAATITPASDADVTLTSSENQSNVRVIETGSWTATHDIICDDADREFTVINNTGFTATITTDGATPTTVDVPDGESMEVRTRAGVGAEIAESFDPFSSQFLHIQDQKPSGTNGGSSAAGYNIRDLNTVLTNEIAGASLAANQVTLPKGDYYISASAPAYSSDIHQLRAYNITSAAYIIDGTSEYSHSATAGTASRSFLMGRVTLSAETAIDFRHLFGASAGANSLGVDSSQAGTIDHNTYTDVKIWRVG